MNYIQINTSQNVNLNFEVASIANRILAFFLDWVFKAAYIIVFFILPLLYLKLDRFLNSLDSFSAGAVVSIIFLPVAFYSLILESIMEGQTFGKKIAKIKVIKIDGYQAKFSDFLIRWFFAIIDIYFSSALVGTLFLIFSKNTQRLGGIASGTAVINLKNQVNIDHTILQNLEKGYTPTFQNVLLLNDTDMQIIKTQYNIGMKNKDYKIISKLAHKIKDIIKVEKTELNDRAFIDTVIKDYNYYTGKED